MIGGAVGGLYLMINNVTAYTMGGLGIFGVLNFINGDDASGMIQSFIAIVLQRSLVLSNILLLERQYS